jgi:hypothetical protein
MLRPVERRHHPRAQKDRPVFLPALGLRQPPLAVVGDLGFGPGRPVAHDELDRLPPNSYLSYKREYIHFGFRREGTRVKLGVPIEFIEDARVAGVAIHIELACANLLTKTLEIRAINYLGESLMF